MDWSAPDRHRTDVERLSEQASRFDRRLDGTEYSMLLDRSSGQLTPADAPHEFALTTGSTVLEIVATFSPDADGLDPGEFDEVRNAAAQSWRRFWTSGAAIDFAGSTDPRAAELERRVVLAQYLTAVNCSGTLPPQETGLVTNSWHGKFHLEMHWWHAAHFASWGRPELLERSMDWYRSALDSARATARQQRYAGARWPKQVGPEARESRPTSDPCSSGSSRTPFTCSNSSTAREGNERAASWSSASPSSSRRRPCSWPPSPRSATASTTWRLRWCRPRSSTTPRPPRTPPSSWPTGGGAWRSPSGGASAGACGETRSGDASRRPSPRREGETYAAVATEPFQRRDDHPSMLCALGVVPATPLVDPSTMEATLLDVRDTWEWDSAWGWDFPAMAMTAARTGRPDLAVEELLMDTAKNVYGPAGHCAQIGSLLPIYLPANGSLLAAVSLMAAGWEGAETPSPRVPGRRNLDRPPRRIQPVALTTENAIPAGNGRLRLVGWVGLVDQTRGAGPQDVDRLGEPCQGRRGRGEDRPNPAVREDQQRHQDPG